VSGGHSGGARGGDGGGALILATSGNLAVAGTISAAGLLGEDSSGGGGGGGGGGGFLAFQIGGSFVIEATATVSAAGGAGGTGPGGQMNDSYGGTGGGGVIQIGAASTANLGTIDVSGANLGIVIQTYYAGDFNGDGKPDILWRNTLTGDNYIWYLDGVARAGGAYLTTVADVNWTIVGKGDFNGEKPEILYGTRRPGELCLCVRMA
jgi:hypothetical protein